MTSTVPELRRIAVVMDYSMTTIGGAETAFYEQVSTLGRHYEVTAMACPAPRLDELGTHQGVTAVPVPIWFRLPLYGLPVTRNTPELTQFFVDTFTRRNVQLVHIHSELAMGAAAVLAAEHLGLPVVHTVHTFFWQTAWPIQRLLGWGAPLYHRFLTGLPNTRALLAPQPGNSAMRNWTLTVAQRVDHVVPPSAHQADRLREAGLERITVIPNTHAAPRDAAPVTQVDPPLRVVWTGRFIAEKRVLPFLRAVRSAMDALPAGALRVDLLGHGEHFRKAQRLAKGYPGIVLHGRVPPEEVLRVLADSQLAAITSVGWDTQPMVVVEAVNALRGGVVCDPNLREGLDGPGIPAYGTDEDLLAQTLVDLVRHPSRVVAASRACLTAREEFSMDTYLARTNQVYAEALDHARARTTS
ncbi:MAG: glycosyltransferase family 4 protein [Propionicimonas sp.]|nr:glycosyltransferase family 4 protein [Propionicimonas sp.]